MEKAYIEKIINQYQYKVRIPRLYKSPDSFNKVNINDLPTAVVCTFPGCSPYYQVGDLVIVGFENDLISKPIIFGKLYNDMSNSESSQLYFSNNVILQKEDTDNKQLEYRLQLIEQKLKDLEEGK